MYSASFSYEVFIHNVTTSHNDNATDGCTYWLSFQLCPLIELDSPGFLHLVRATSTRVRKAWHCVISTVHWLPMESHVAHMGNWEKPTLTNIHKQYWPTLQPEVGSQEYMYPATQKTYTHTHTHLNVSCKRAVLYCRASQARHKTCNVAHTHTHTHIRTCVQGHQ